MQYNAVFPATITTATTLSSEVNLGHSWRNVFLVIPSMTSNSTLHIKAADVTGGTFRRIVQKDPASGAATVDFEIGSATTNRIVEIPAAGLRYLKIESVNVLSFAAAFQIICGN